MPSPSARMPRKSLQKAQDGRGLGWLPEPPDHRDAVYGLLRTLRTAEEVKPSVDLRPFMSPVRDQGEEGSCTGHGTAAGMDYLCRDNPSGEQHDTCTIYSPRFIYYNTRRLGGANQLRQDNGGFIRNAIKSVVQYGTCSDADWPYIPGEYRKAPTPAQLRAGQSWMLDKYLKCLTLNGVLSALHKGHPVVAGFMCHTGMWTPTVDKTGVLPTPTDADQPDGGHCTLWCGYNVSDNIGPKRHILFKNSWGEGWGENGYGWLPFEFIENRLASDMWALIKEKS